MSTNREPIGVIGTGYVGLVTGACLADFGHQVACIDKDSERIDRLNNGIIPIYEPGLDALVKTNREAGRLRFSTKLAPAVKEADAVFIAVGTPSRRGDGYADLSFVYEAAREIAAALDDYTLVVTKSTVPVGTGDEIEDIIRKIRPDADFAVVSNPEFQAEGQFDPAKYQRWIQSPATRQQGVLVMLEGYYRSEIPKAKLAEQK